jgi:predicted unusual protein kinase regulating ubiquinone biosynthesis (AarF/ABC1/UbiB family)
MAKGVPTSRLSRGSKLGAAVAGQIVRHQRTRVSMLGRSEQARARMAEESTIQAAEQVVTVLGGMKGVAMKLGQMLSILDLDLVPPDHRESFQRKLAVLRDSAPKTSFTAMRAVIEEDLGKPLDELFAEFDEEAIAAASIGQVYRATLHDGRKVAVKVQYPGIAAAVEADLKNLTMFAKFWRVAMPWVTPALLEELQLNLGSELDYVREAETQHHIARLFTGHPLFAVPDSIPELSSRRVLVTEFIEATGFEGIRAMPLAERNRVAEIIYRFYVGSLYTYNEFCGDPHPGNVMLCPDGRVAFVDFGLFNRMDPAHVEFELACLRAAAEERGDDLYKLMVDNNVIDPKAGVSVNECLDYVYAASEWCLVDQELEITPELASGAFLLAIDPRATEFAAMKRQNLPPEHLFSRRADFLTFGIVGQLGATANWHRIAREWIYGEPPVTELGRVNQQWIADRERSTNGSKA